MSISRSDLPYLRSLRAVERVSWHDGRARIRYTEEFRRMAVRRYRAGESPARIFREAGLDSAMIGYKRIERCIARWRDLPDGDAAAPSATRVPAAPVRRRARSSGDRATVRALSYRVAELEGRIAELETRL